MPSGKALRGASFKNVTELSQGIDAFILSPSKTFP
jgi:hypothetical protein